MFNELKNIRFQSSEWNCIEFLMNAQEKSTVTAKAATAMAKQTHQSKLDNEHIPGDQKRTGFLDLKFPCSTNR